MKTITIKQPWASLIVEGIKDIENRTWNTKFRGRVLVHSSAKDVPVFSTKLTNEQFDIYSQNLIDGVVLNMQQSVIIGSVEIVDCVINHSSIWADKSDPELWDENGNPIYDKPIYNWVLVNPIKFEKPILNVKGKLSFWEYDLD